MASALADKIVFQWGGTQAGQPKQQESRSNRRGRKGIRYRMQEMGRAEDRRREITRDAAAVIRPEFEQDEDGLWVGPSDEDLRSRRIAAARTALEVEGFNPDDNAELVAQEVDQAAADAADYDAVEDGSCSRDELEGARRWHEDCARREAQRAAWDVTPVLTSVPIAARSLRMRGRSRAPRCGAPRQRGSRRSAARAGARGDPDSADEPPLGSRLLIGGRL
jgi:hypothetical protein